MSNGLFLTKKPKIGFIGLKQQDFLHYRFFFSDRDGGMLKLLMHKASANSYLRNYPKGPFNNFFYRFNKKQVVFFYSEK